ncbi:hypothetical protein [Ramlibacter sp. AN1133]|uniref:hypothetical protein n=1 Tax=Ramlibacter sp. AN1133 TaxID=3133429 RepID=UPI0030BFA5DF
MRNRSIAALALAGATLVLCACGGGGGGGKETPGGAAPPPAVEPNPPAATTLDISGVAAVGRPFAGALVTVYASGSAAGTTTVQLDGAYALTIPASAAGPLVVEATLGSDSLVSMAPEAKSGRINVTKFTNLIASQLAPDGDPLSLKRDAASVTTAAVAEKVQLLATILKPLRDAAQDAIDPISGVFAADGTGHDQALSAVSVVIHPTGAGANIEVSYTTVFADDGSPLSTTFTSAQTTAIAPLPPVTQADLPPPSLDGMIDDLTQRMTACFALPLPQRVRNVGATATAVIGTGEDIVAAECRSLFVGDDPTTYLSNGGRVGRDRNGNGAFSGIFRAGATGVKFDQGNFEFLRNNAQKDVVFTFRTVGSNGDESFDQVVARQESGKLKLFGNQYIYSARVRPIVEDREFLNQPAASYVLTGYDFFVNNLLDGSGNPVFSKVVVTAPKPGTQTFTLAPNAGRDGLTLQRPNGTLTQTSAIGLAAQFRNGDPRAPGQFDTGLLFQSPALADEDIRKIPAMGVWTVEFFHADSTRPNVVQTYRTISRALTVAEALQRPMAQLTDAAKAALRADGNPQSGVLVFGANSTTDPNVFLLTLPDGGDAWQVTPPALPPTLVQVFGRGPAGTSAPGAPFSDSVNVSPSARKGGRIDCSRLGTADTHCDSSVPAQFAQGTSISVIQLFTTSRRQEELSKINALYFILPRP